MKTLLSGILLLFSVSLLAQNYNKAIVTDLNFIRRYSVEVDGDKFPFYFNHKEFVIDIQDEIRNLIQKKFQISDVLFLTPDSIYYSDQTTMPKTQAKDYAQVTQRDQTIFIAIESIIQIYTVIDQERTFRFTTRIKVYDGKGKVIYRFKNHIPFVPVYGDPIAGIIDISEQDFYTFYFDGLYYAFQGKESIVRKVYNIKPMAEDYIDFTLNAEKLYLETENNGYDYGQDYERLSEVASFSINYWAGDNDKFDFINLATVEFLDGGYNFTNKLDNNEYQVRLKGGVNSLKKTYDPLANITWQLLFADGEVVGEVVYNKKSNLVGKYADTDIELIWNGNFSCIEIKYRGETKALVNYSTDSKVLYLSKDINRNELIALINCMFVYDYSRAVRTRLIVSYNSR